MAIDFPNSPSTNEEFSVGATTWVWDGTTWNIKSKYLGYTPNIDGGLYNSTFGGVPTLDAGAPA